MNISAIEGKGKGYKGKGKYKGERQRKGYGRYKVERQGKSYGRHKGEGKGKDSVEHKGKEKGYRGYRKDPAGQRQEHKGRRKEAKGKDAQDRCYRCGQQRHIAKHCRVSFYNYREAPTATAEQHDTTYQRHEDPHGRQLLLAQHEPSRTTTCITSATHTLQQREHESYKEEA